MERGGISNGTGSGKIKVVITDADSLPTIIFFYLLIALQNNTCFVEN